jgi:glycosyltransferase involved in cell wall biosynthesis
MPLRPMGALGVRVSVIVTTYNSPRALALVLAGLARQSVRDFEILVADDGSGPETAALVGEYGARAPVPVRHIWHPDEGFRKCAISNKAIEAAAGDYLVFFDGDCIPMRTCLEAHLRGARRDSYLAGGKLSLRGTFADRLTPEMVAGGALDRIGPWWWRVGKRERLFVSRVPLLRDWMNSRVPREPSWRGENSSAFSEHVFRAGGFDERFSYGYEDAEFGHRLQAAGVHGRSIRYTAPVFHLEHERPYARPEVVDANRALYQASRAQRSAHTEFGLRPRGPEAG